MATAKIHAGPRAVDQHGGGLRAGMVGWCSAARPCGRGTCGTDRKAAR